ncbi:MAG: hypothetical protein NVS2B16_22190 [Chloroflexota bacterium]
MWGSTRAPLLALACTGILAMGAFGCGDSQSSPHATPTTTILKTSGPALDRQAVRVAGQFLNAFKSVMIRLMTPRLRQRNRSEYVQHMLGVQSTPARVDILRARTFHSRNGMWTRIVARLEFDHGASTDVLGIVRTGAGYRVAGIRALKSGRQQ